MPGSRTVTVTGTSASGATAATTFVSTIWHRVRSPGIHAPPKGPLPPKGQA
jgi:hypothetical protein